MGNLAAMVISNEKGGAGGDLYLAARDGQVDLVSQLATREQPADRTTLLNASYTEGEQSCTPLIIASRNGHTGVVSALLDLCCQVEAEGTVKFDGHVIEGATPLWCAAGAGHQNIVELLVA